MLWVILGKFITESYFMKLKKKLVNRVFVSQCLFATQSRGPVKEVLENQKWHTWGKRETEAAIRQWSGEGPTNPRYRKPCGLFQETPGKEKEHWTRTAQRQTWEKPKLQPLSILPHSYIRPINICRNKAAKQNNWQWNSTEFYISNGRLSGSVG